MRNSAARVGDTSSVHPLLLTLFDNTHRFLTRVTHFVTRTAEDTQMTGAGEALHAHARESGDKAARSIHARYYCARGRDQSQQDAAGRTRGADRRRQQPPAVLRRAHCEGARTPAICGRARVGAPARAAQARRHLDRLARPRAARERGAPGGRRALPDPAGAAQRLGDGPLLPRVLQPYALAAAALAHRTGALRKPRPRHLRAGERPLRRRGGGARGGGGAHLGARLPPDPGAATRRSASSCTFPSPPSTSFGCCRGTASCCAAYWPAT
jgi:hypothetical protein